MFPRELRRPPPLKHRDTIAAGGFSPRYIDHRFGELVRPLTRLGSFERLFGLDREAEGDFRRAVEDLKQMIAEQAAILALGAAN
jgi:hypothetical protein